MQPCPLLDFRPWERIRFCVSTAHMRSSVAAAPGLQYSPSWRKLVSSPPKASGSSEATTVSGHLYGQRGTGTQAAVAPACRRRKALWVRPCWVEPAGLCLLPLTFTAWGRGIVKPPAPIRKDGLEGVALWSQHVGSPTHQIIRGLTPPETGRALPVGSGLRLPLETLASRYP